MDRSAQWRELTELADLSATELLAAYRTGDASPTEAVRSCLERISSLDSVVKAVVTLTADEGLDAAASSTERWARGTPRALEGVPFGLKDIICTAGVRTTGGSKLYEHNVPQQSATVASRLQEAGAIMVGKLQTYELGYGRDPLFGAPRNPWDLTRTTGGSSCGSAAAVAARELPVALGTDTGGSIRVPAAFCGVVGLKPTYGLVPRTNVMPLSWTMDHVGPMARSVDDVALVLSVIAGPDGVDPTCRSGGSRHYPRDTESHVRGIRVGVPRDWFYDICDPAVEEVARRAVQHLTDAGAVAVEVDLPHLRSLDPEVLGRTIIYAECASLHESSMDRLSDYGADFQELLLAARRLRAHEYLKALRLRALIQRDFEVVFDQVDVLLVPAAVSEAPTLDGMAQEVNQRAYPWLQVTSRTTRVFNLIGSPAIALPAGLSTRGLPLGIQLAARPFHEWTCFRVARYFQETTNHHLRPPPLLTDPRALDDAHVLLGARR